MQPRLQARSVDRGRAGGQGEREAMSEITVKMCYCFGHGSHIAGSKQKCRFAKSWNDLNNAHADLVAALERLQQRLDQGIPFGTGNDLELLKAALAKAKETA